MSKRTFDDFFPGAIALYEVLFPKDVVKLCPEIIWTYQFDGDDDLNPLPVVVRQPALAVSALLGCIIGINGSILVQDRNKSLLSLSLMAFAWMNISALFLHCLFPAPPSISDRTSTSNYPEFAPWTWMLDCYLTGISATSYSLAILHDIHMVSNLLMWFIHVNLMGIVCVLIFVYLDATLPLELWYLVPVLFTGPASVIYFGQSLISCRRIPSLSRLLVQFIALTFLAAGGLSILIGVHQDAAFCRSFGHKYYDSLTMTNMIFFGCDLAFLGVALWHSIDYAPSSKRIVVDDSRKQA